MKTVVLVSCVGQKLERPAQAADLYISTWFTKARRYAELAGDDWYILSAKHGLLEPGQVVEPYNLTLKEYTPKQREAWAGGVLGSIVARVPKGSTIIILAGRLYRVPLATLLGVWYTVSTPTAGMGIGRQLAWLDKQIGACYGAKRLTLETTIP